MGLMRFGINELSILLVIAALLMCGPTIGKRIGLRTLNFGRTGDTLLGIMIVSAFLATFLVLGR